MNVWFGMQSALVSVPSHPSSNFYYFKTMEWSISHSLLSSLWVPSARFCTWFTINGEKNADRILHNRERWGRKSVFSCILFTCCLGGANIILNFNWLYFLLEKEAKTSSFSHTTLLCFWCHYCWPILPSCLGAGNRSLSWGDAIPTSFLQLKQHYPNWWLASNANNTKIMHIRCRRTCTRWAW